MIALVEQAPPAWEPIVVYVISIVVLMLLFVVAALFMRGSAKRSEDHPHDEEDEHGIVGFPYFPVGRTYPPRIG